MCLNTNIIQKYTHKNVPWVKLRHSQTWSMFLRGRLLSTRQQGWARTQPQRSPPPQLELQDDRPGDTDANDSFSSGSRGADDALCLRLTSNPSFFSKKFRYLSGGRGMGGKKVWRTLKREKDRNHKREKDTRLSVTVFLFTSFRTHSQSSCLTAH